MRLLTLIALAAFLTSCQTSEYTLNISADVDDDNQIFLIALDGRRMIGTPGVLLQHVKPEAGRLKNQSSKGNSRRRMKEPH